jgi:hypothetical protein
MTKANKESLMRRLRDEAKKLASVRDALREIREEAGALTTLAEKGTDLLDQAIETLKVMEER